MQVTIVEPTHFEVPGGANESDVSAHSLLTTDTTSNREGSMASSPGSTGGFFCFELGSSMKYSSLAAPAEFSYMKNTCAHGFS